MGLKIVHASFDRWQEFVGWFLDRKLEVPAPTEHVVFVEADYALVGDKPALLAGVCLYPSTGPWVIVEHVSTNPDASSESRDAALKVIAATLKVYGATTGKALLCFPRDHSIAQRLEAFGWIYSKAWLMVCAPEVDTGMVVGQKNSP